MIGYSSWMADSDPHTVSKLAEKLSFVLEGWAIVAIIKTAFIRYI